MKDKILYNYSSAVLLTLIAIFTVAFSVDNNAYVLYAPEITRLYNVAISDDGYILRSYFIGTCIAGLLVGPLVDNFGKKKVLVIGVLLYLASSVFANLSNSFFEFILWRFMMGVAKSVPIVVCWSIIFDQELAINSGKKVSFIQGIASCFSIFMPYITLGLSQIFGWHITLLFSSVIVGLTFFIIIPFVPETKEVDTKKTFKVKTIFLSYWTLLKNPLFMANILIYAATSLNLNVFSANASTVFVDHLGVSKIVYDNYQTLNTIVYVIFSFLGIKFVASKGLDFTKNLGLVIFVVGCFVLYFIAIRNDINTEAIFLSFLITAAGAALMNGFLLKAINYVPEMKATAMALSSSIASLLAVRGNFWAQHFFDDTIIPAVTVIFICSIVLIFLFLFAYYKAKSRAE